MRGYRSAAIVLRRTDYGEADRVVQFLTPEGKKSALARGVRREKSKLAGGIELLALTDITLQQGKGELLTLTSARLEKFYSHILEDYDRLQFAYYALKDIGRASEQITEEGFFVLLQQTLVALDDKRISLGIIELCYRMQMADLLGLGANLTRESNGKKLVADGSYRFTIENMAFESAPNGEYISDHIKLLRLATVSRPEVVAHVSGVGELLGLCLFVARAAHE